jgi:hypothetical protein
MSLGLMSLVMLLMLGGHVKLLASVVCVISRDG